MIEFRDVHVSYDAATPVLRGVNLRIEQGEFVAFVGTNGAGKSTTMRLINGLLKPDAGQVTIDGVPTGELATSQLARRVGFLFQNPDNQICCSTVGEELLFGLRALGVDEAEAHKRVARIVARFGFDANADPFLLNRGTRQLLALASIVVLGVPVIVLDEPTTGLDYRECTQVMDLIAQLHADGTTVVMVCHDMEIVADYAHRVVVMHEGRVIDDGPTFDVLRNPATLAQASLLPSQIVQLSLELAARHAELAGSPVAAANDLDQMVHACLAQLGGADG
ncbi:MAG: ABC transporter ATP-binding protein [Eggerthellaceae bacterium]|nr:ABC transporter ATP-binding protein [Eggerthellaceae bacterium]MBQ9067496.1 ABC transporter ATP-binding protein [Eggerthellaceae bacterium]